MKLADRIKPISHLKANAPDVIQSIAEDRQPVIITVHGEAKAVLQDIESFEQTQEALALLKVLALTHKNVEAGKVRPVREAFARVRKRVGA